MLDAGDQDAGGLASGGEFVLSGGFLEELVGFVAACFGVGADGGEGRPGAVGEDAVGVVGAGSAAGSFDAVRRQMAGLGRACAEAGRDVAELDKIVLAGFTPEFNPALAGAGARPFDSVDAFVDFAGRHAELGFTELVIHAPVPADGPGFDAAVADEKLFEEIATRGAAKLTG